MLPKHAWLGLLKDAVTGQRAQDAVQHVSVDAPLTRELVAAPRAGRERLRHTQIGDEPERPRHQRTSQRIPDDPLSVHARAAWTAAVASSELHQPNDTVPCPRPANSLLRNETGIPRRGAAATSWTVIAVQSGCGMRG